jgi:hypothetical protein
MAKLSAYPVLSSAAANDTIPIVDVDDPAESPVTGSTKKITVANLLGSGISGQPLPWNVLGGYVASSYDPNLAIISINLGQPAFTPSTGFIYASACVTDTTVPFSQVAMIGDTAQTGTGAITVLTDVNGNLVASATNADAAYTGISATPQYLSLVLDSTVTPPAAGTIYYLMQLWPTATVSVTPTFYISASSANWFVSQSEVLHPSSATSFSGSNTAIPNPQPITGLTNALNQPQWFALL